MIVALPVIATVLVVLVVVGVIGYFLDRSS